MVCEFLQSALSVEVKDGDPCSSKDTGVMDMLETTKEHEENHTQIMPSVPKKMMSGINSPSSFIPTHEAWAIEKMEATVKQESCDIAAIIETWVITGVLQWITLNSSERTGKEKEMMR